MFTHWLWLRDAILQFVRQMMLTSISARDNFAALKYKLTGIDLYRVISITG